jgi:hydroxymethylbilane synthase
LKYKIGTRGSKLSLAQTNWVISELKEHTPDNEFDIVTIKTKGDTDERPLFTIDQKGIFEKEIDRAVAEKQVDFAVHSLKDVPSELHESLIIASVPKRESSNDIFITKDGSSLKSIPSGSIIGTSSLRRAVQISRQRSDLVVKPVRGNIETRINKVLDGKFDGIVLAHAGISRLGLDVKFSILSTKDFPPSPGQGALAIVARSNDSELISILKKIEDIKSRKEIEAERALSDHVDSGCRFPVGALAKIDAETMNLVVAAYSVDGKKSLIIERTGSIDDPKILGRKLGLELKDRGIEELASNWREKLEEWNKK